MHVPFQGRKTGDDCMLTCIVESENPRAKGLGQRGKNSVKSTAWRREELAGVARRPKAHRSLSGSEVV